MNSKEHLQEPQSTICSIVLQVNFFNFFSRSSLQTFKTTIVVLILLPLEIATKYLERVTQVTVQALLERDITGKEPEMLNAITKPFTNLIIQLDKKALENLVHSNITDEDFRLLKHNCKKETLLNSTYSENMSNNTKGKCKYINTLLFKYN